MLLLRGRLLLSILRMLWRLGIARGVLLVGIHDAVRLGITVLGVRGAYVVGDAVGRIWSLRRLLGLMVWVGVLLARRVLRLHDVMCSGSSGSRGMRAVKTDRG